MLSQAQCDQILYDVSEDAYYNLAVSMVKTMVEDYKRAIKRKDFSKAKEYLHEIKTSDYTNFLVSDPNYIVEQVEKEYGNG